jgi:hypothetical protein
MLGEEKCMTEMITYTYIRVKGNLKEPGAGTD